MLKLDLVIVSTVQYFIYKADISESFNKEAVPDINIASRGFNTR